MNKEILNIIEYLSNERSISKDKIFNIIESILKFSIKKIYGNDFIFRINLDKKKGTFKIFKINNVIDNINNSNLIINSKNLNNNNLLKNSLEEEINNINFNRVIIQNIKIFLFQKVKELEKIELYNKYYNFLGKLFSCSIRKILNNKILLFIDNNIDGIIYKNNLIPSDNFNINDRFRGILYFIKNTSFGIKLFITRSGIDFVKNLFENEIDNVSNFFKIMSISRVTGYKTKIAIKFNNNNFNSFSYFLTINKLKIKNISNELNNEYIDIILWDDNLFKFIKNSFYPINIKSIFFSNNKDINLLIDKNNYIKIKNKSNLDIKLISSLVKYKLNIILS